MKKRIIGLVLGTLAISLGTFLGVGSFNKEAKVAKAYYSPSTHYEVSDTASELASYYSCVETSDTGDTLLGKLRTINSSKYHKNFSYKNFGTSSSTSPYVYTDYPLTTTTKDSNGQIRGSSIASFYTKTTADSFNKEHVWPDSKGGNKVENDILMPRPTIAAENSSRGNSNFVENMNSSSGGWDPYAAGYDIACRGECARIMLYCVVSSSQLSLVASNSGGSTSCGNMNTLIKWHFDYAPNVYEMNRNNGAEYLQGNRNPFVDHPEYVAKIWSNFNSTVSSLCTSNANKYSSWVPGNYCNYGENTPVNNDGVTISKSSDSVPVGSTITLSATASNSGAISWTTSNSSVASISSSSSASGANITITGVSAGTATITAKATISGTQYSSACTVTVTKVVSSLSKGSTSPTKTTYTAGESFDPTGLTITATYTDSTSSNVTSSVVWSPDPLTAGTTSVTGTFGGKTITITGLTVNAPTEPEIIDSNSDLSVGDYVVLRTAAGVGVTGWNNNKDATVSETDSEWKKFYVASASSSGFTLKDVSANNFIASPGGSNQFIYGSAGTCSTDSDGHLICNNRYLCKNGTNYRFYTSVGSYLPFFIYKVPGSSSTKILSSISVSTAPTKTSYTAGEYFDPTGLVITRTYSDSTSDTYTYANHTSDFTFSPNTSTALTTSNTSVTITYGGKTCSQTISVTAAAKTLSSIAISGYQDSFTEGDTFSFGGTVTAYYTDLTSEDVTSSASFTGYNMTTVGNQTVTVSFGGLSQTYGITVSAGTLSSIVVSGMTTTFVKNAAFSFDGTCTATFENGYQKIVTPTSVSSPDMSTAGNKQVTVSYSYNGKTKSTTYNITVNSYRVVLEASEVEGQITWPTSGNASVSGVTATVTNVEYTYYESGDKALRLGTGSGGGKIRIEASNIVSIQVKAKAYSSYSGALSIGSSSINVKASSYTDYDAVEFASPVNELYIYTSSKQTRICIKQINIVCLGPEVDIGQTEDCLGLETYINNYMHMDYTENLGYCNDSEHHYYATAKAEFNKLNDHQRSLFTGNSAYLAEWTRLSTWASKNNDSLNSKNSLVTSVNSDSLNSLYNDSSLLIIIIISSLATCSLLSLLIIKKRKYEKKS